MVLYGFSQSDATLDATNPPSQLKTNGDLAAQCLEDVLLSKPSPSCTLTSDERVRMMDLLMTTASYYPLEAPFWTRMDQVQ